VVLLLFQVSSCSVLINLRNNVLNFCSFHNSFWVQNWVSRASTNSRSYHGNNLVMTLIIAIFEHPPWISTCMQIWVRGQNFSFPTLFDSYRELLLRDLFSKRFMLGSCSGSSSGGTWIKKKIINTKTKKYQSLLQPTVQPRLVNILAPTVTSI